MPTLEKILEIVVKKQLDEYLSRNNIIVHQQSGFRKSHSCETALNRIIDDWRDNLEKKKIIFCIFLDLKRAFETIDRDSLLMKLEQIGVRRKEKSWFKSYLTERFQQTKIGEFISSKIQNDIGVPQGTVLASLLFSIYINNICTIIENNDKIKINLFADDTEIHIATDNLNDGLINMSNILEKLESYFKQNKLKLNVSKTKCMIIRNRSISIDKNNIKLTLENQIIECVSEIKYLCVIIDEFLDFNKHVNYICNKSSSKAALLHRIENKIKTEERICVYKTIIAL